MTTPDDKLAALMAAVGAAMGKSAHPLNKCSKCDAVRAAAVAYGRAVAIAELEERRQEMARYGWGPFRNPAELIDARLAELRQEVA